MNTKFARNQKITSLKDASLDFKLMFIYHISMTVLFVSTFLPNSLHQLYFASGLTAVLVSISIAHKLKSKWSWPGLSLTGLLSALFNLVFIYIFLAASSNLLDFSNPGINLNINDIKQFLIDAPDEILSAASNPQLTPWYLGALGIGVMNILVSLKLATLKRKDFEAQCSNILQGQ